MENKKKQIPSAIMHTVEPIVQANLKYISVFNESDTYYTLIDKDPGSRFYFKIFKETPSNMAFSPSQPGNYIYVEFTPGSTLNLSKSMTGIELGKVDKLIEGWLGYLKEYEKIESVYDDPIIRANKERFSNQYKILDKDADTATFSFEQQLLLEKYFKDIINKADEFKDESNKELIDEVKVDAKSIIEQITVLPKNQIMDKLITLWAKAQKASLPFIKWIMLEGGKELFVEVIKQSIGY